MFARALVLALLTWTACAPAQAADGWKITAMEGDVTYFRQGSWTKLKVGDNVANNVLTRTGGNGAMTLARGVDSITLDPNTEIQIEERPAQHASAVRLHSGTLGVEAKPGARQPVTIQTGFAIAEVKDSLFGIQAEAGKTTISVQRGAVDITDVAHKKRGKVSEGKSAKVNSARGIVIAAGVPSEPAGLAAAKIAGTFTSVADPDVVDNSIKEMRAPPKIAPEILAVATPTAIAAPSPPKAAAPESATAMSSADDEGQSTTADQRRFYTDVANFSWSEGRAGRVVMTPLLKIAFGLHGADALMFWPCALFCFMFVGLLLQLTLRDMAFGGFYNTILTVAATCIGIAIRDVILVDATYLHFEPIMTVATVLGTLILAMVSLRVAASRIA